MARREWKEQVRLAQLLNNWLDPIRVCWTATDPVAASVTSGFLRKKRGVRPGIPDVLVWYCGQSITIELKSRHGQCTPSQRAMRTELVRAGVQWWVCRSAISAMATLYAAGVPFRLHVADDGTLERWVQPELPDWERSKSAPHERRPRAPADWEPGAEETTELVAASDDATGGDIAA